MPLVQGQMKNQWFAGTGHLNCSLESTARPALPTLMSGPALLNAVLRFFVHPPGMPLSHYHELGIQQGNPSEHPVKN